MNAKYYDLFKHYFTTIPVVSNVLKGFSEIYNSILETGNEAGLTWDSPSDYLVALLLTVIQDTIAVYTGGKSCGFFDGIKECYNASYEIYELSWKVWYSNNFWNELGQYTGIDRIDSNALYTVVISDLYNNHEDMKVSGDYLANIG